MKVNTRYFLSKKCSTKKNFQLKDFKGFMEKYYFDYEDTVYSIAFVFHCGEERQAVIVHDRENCVGTMKSLRELIRAIMN